MPDTESTSTESTGTESPTVLVLVRDLMFTGRISAEARAAEVPLKFVRDPATLSQFTGLPARLLIVDLNLPGAIPAAAAWAQGSDRSVVGFVSHVDAQTIAQAKEAKIDQILPRSRFVQILPELLRGQLT